MAAVKMARIGSDVNDALILLLEANIQQAEQAGAQGAGAAKLLNKIRYFTDTFSMTFDQIIKLFTL
jgi:hypothetical protein